MNILFSLNVLFSNLSLSWSNEKRLKIEIFQNPLEEKLHKHPLFYATTRLLKKLET
jgi:hypothetical protein